MNEWIKEINKATFRNTVKTVILWNKIFLKQLFSIVINIKQKEIIFNTDKNNI